MPHWTRQGEVFFSGVGAPGRIRTCGLWLRRPTLYPAELRALIENGELVNRKIGEWRHRHSRYSVCTVAVARPAGLEPATYGFEVRRSIQLSYGRTNVHHITSCRCPREAAVRSGCESTKIPALLSVPAKAGTYS